MQPSCNERGIGTSPSLEPQTSKGNKMGECTLYVEPDFSEALKIGMKVFQHGTQDGPTDQCTIDAALELGQHVNGLLRGLGVTPEKLEAMPAIDPPRSVDNGFALIGVRCWVSSLSVKDGQASVDEKMLTWLWAILKWLIPLIFGGNLQPVGGGLEA